MSLNIRISHFFGLLAALVLLLASCAKEELMPPAQSPQEVTEKTLGSTGSSDDPTYNGITDDCDDEEEGSERNGRSDDDTDGEAGDRGDGDITDDSDDEEDDDGITDDSDDEEDDDSDKSFDSNSAHVNGE